MKCVICEARSARRHCPGVHGDICSICCGTAREETIDCPLDCVYLREARLHEKAEESPADIPLSDIRVPDGFFDEHTAVFEMTISSLMKSILAGGVVDLDAREALETLARTYKTRQSGLVYESRPNNPIAARVHDELIAGLEEARNAHRESSGVSVRDSEVLYSLVLLQRLTYRFHNGRRRGRAFIDYLMSHFGDPDAPQPAASPLIL